MAKNKRIIQRISRYYRQHGGAALAAVGMRRAIWSIYFYFCRFINVNNVRSAYGPRFRKNYSDVTFRFYITGAYDFHLARTIQCISESFVFIDVGANQGLYSILAAKNPKCEHVIAFEPVPQTWQRLRENLMINNVSSKVNPVRAAVGDVARNVDMCVPATHSGAASIIETDIPQAGGGGGCETVQQLGPLQVDEILLPAKDLPMFIKVDAEGFDERIVSALRNLKVWSAVQWIYFETKNAAERNDLLQSLSKEGFVEKYRTNTDRSSCDILVSKL